VPSLKTLFIVAFEDGNELDRSEMFFSQYGPRGDTKLIKIDHCTSHLKLERKADLAASLWVVAVAAIGPLPTSSGSKPFSICRNH
jgi:hypothetical protein